MTEYDLLWDKRDELWHKACAWEGIVGIDAFIGEAVFSKDNPWAKLWRTSEEDLLRMNIRLMERAERHK